MMLPPPYGIDVELLPDLWADFRVFRHACVDAPFDARSFLTF